MPIIEKRIFNFKGQQFTKEEITDLREYRDVIRGHIQKKLVKRYEGRRGVFFLLDDDRMVVVLLGSRAEAPAYTSAPVVSEGIAAS